MVRGRASAAGREETLMKESAQALCAFSDYLTWPLHQEHLSQSKQAYYFL